MEERKYIWMNGKLIPSGDAKVHVLAHSLHYGYGALKGVRVYKTDRGPAVFRLSEYMDRLLYSSGVVADPLLLPDTRPF